MSAWLVAEGAQAVVRALLFAGIIVVIGASLFVWRIAPVFDGDGGHGAMVRHRAQRLLQLSLILLVVVLAARLVLQAAAFADSPGEWPSTVALVLTRTTWGNGWFVQAAALVLVAVSAPAAFRVVAPRRWPLGIGALALAASPALAGHAVGAPRLASVAVALDTLHVTAAGGWMGTLLVIVLIALPAARARDDSSTSQVLELFSPLALACALVVAGTGVFASWLHLETLGNLWRTSYGRTLLLKLGLLAGVAALGAYNWRIVTPRLRATGDNRALRRSAIAELSLAAALIAVTAVLVATPLPAEG